MATIDTSIYGRVSSGADLGGIVRGYAAGQQIRGQQNENRLRDMAMAEKEGLNDAYRTSYDPDTGQINQNKLYAMMAERGIGSAIPAAQQAAATAQKAGNDAKASERANQYKMLEWARNGVTASQDPQSARNYLMGGVQYGFLTPEMAQQEAASIPDDPAAFMAWKQQTQQSMLSAQQQLDGYYRQQDLNLKGERLQHDIRKANTDSSGAKPPAGYRYSNDGSTLEAIPGGPADIKAGELGKKTEERQKTAVSQATRVMNKVDEAIEKIGFWSTGFGSDSLASIGGTDARALRSALDTIKANLGFAELQAMREASPTGGALGSVAVQELMALQSTIASLDQGLSSDVLKQNLLQIKQHYQNWLDVVQQAETEGGGSQPTAMQQQAQQSQQSNGPKLGEIIDGWQYQGGDPSNPQSWRQLGG